MLYFVDGKNGSGKSLFAMHQIVDMLEMTEKTVITNMEEIKLPELNDLLHRRAAQAGRDAPDLHKRLVIIRKDETPEYYRYRSGNLVLPKVKEEDEMGKRMKMSDFLDVMKEYFKPVGATPETAVGVVYFLDEVQDYFNAREWANTGRAVMWHVGKHRHLDDDIYWMTPASEEVETTLRRKAHNWYRLQNRYRVKFKGFKVPGKFIWQKFYGIPGPNSIPESSGSFKLDPVDGFASTYRTTGALGVGSGKPETSGMAKGPPFWMMCVGIGIAMVAFFFVMMAVPKIMGRALGHSMAVFRSGISGSSVNTLAHGNVLNDLNGAEPSVATSVVSNSSTVLHYCGQMSDGSQVFVLLSDSQEWHSVGSLLGGGVVKIDDGRIAVPESDIQRKSRVHPTVTKIP